MFSSLTKISGRAVVTRPLVVYRNNNVAKVTVAANGDVFATSFNPISSRALKHDIVNLDSRKASETVRQLTPVEFVYNADESGEKRVGFIAEDVPELVAAKDHKTLSSMDLVAVLTKVVQEQQKTMDAMQKRLEQLEAKQQ